MSMTSGPKPYDLEVRCTAQGVAAIDAEAKVLDMLNGQYRIDETWTVTIEVEPNVWNYCGEPVTWEARLSATLPASTGEPSHDS